MRLNFSLKKVTKSGISSMKLTPATNVTASRNQMWSPISRFNEGIHPAAAKANQIHNAKRKIIPPPRRTMLECDER